MVVGIIDLDLLYTPQSYEANLDVMQISGYHKQMGDKVKLCPSEKKEDIEWYSMLYVIYNGEKQIYIDHLIKSEKVTLIGSYFYNKYCAVPKEIRAIYPDTTIYDAPIVRKLLSDSRYSYLRNKLIKSDFIRLHESSNKRFISSANQEITFYDTDITDSDYEEIIKLNKKISFYYPVTIHSYTQAKRWVDAKVYSRAIGNINFIVKNCIEKDISKILDFPAAQRQKFSFIFGECSVENYNLELKKFLRMAQKGKFMNPKPNLKVAPINNVTYKFLFDCGKKWYGSNYTLKEDADIFHTYFNNKHKYELMVKIKAKDPELYQLLTYTLSVRYQDEQARKHYNRVD